MKSRFKIFKQYLWLALLVILARVLFRIFFDEFSWENLLASLSDGAKLAVWVIGFGVLNAVVDFRKLFKRSPVFVKTPITALNISFTLTPEIGRSIERIRAASKLRFQRKGIHLIRSVIVPTLANAIDQALNLGDSMKARGYGSKFQTNENPGEVELQEVSFAYRDQTILKKLSMKIRPGSLVSITGSTGSGKSTLLKVIQARHPNCAFVNQFPRDGFVAGSVYEEMAFALVQRRVTETEIRTRVLQIAKTFELQEFLNTDPFELSAGYQQRLAIASNLISGAKLLLLDEPFSALDSKSSGQLIVLLENLRRSGVTVIAVEHRVEHLNEIANQLFTLTNGNLTPGQERPVPLRKLSGLSRKITVLVGENGAGKTTYLRKLAQNQGVLVPQPASDLLFLNSVAEELDQADRDAQKPVGTSAEILEKLIGTLDPAHNPRDLSQGQKLALAISMQLAKSTDLLMLDEPTLGFDLPTKQALVDLIGKVEESGVEILVATHDEDFADAISNRKQLISDGIVTDV